MVNLKDIPKIRETDGKEKTFYLKFKEMFGRGEWYVCEAEKQPDGDILFFGYVKLLYDEWGYFTLNQLKEVPTIELVKNFTPCKVEEITEA